MRLLLTTLLSSLFCLTLIAQPPTKAEHESRSDIGRDDYPSAASARGSAVGTRQYAPTPSMREDMRDSKEIAGRTRPNTTVRRVIQDGDYSTYQSGVYTYNTADAYGSAPLQDPNGVTVGELRYGYDAQGRLNRVERYDLNQSNPNRVLTYTYDNDFARESELQADGTYRYIRDIGMDRFQASQGPGNQPYLDNRSINEGYSNSNSTPSRPTSPGSDNSSYTPNN